MTSVRIRITTLVVAAAAIAAGLWAGLGTAAATPTSSGPASIGAHPYSDPVWWPVHSKVYVDCVLSNPGCSGLHNAWTMDVVKETTPQGSAAGDTGVYAMGAGVLHVGDAHGSACHDGAHSNYGTWVWIDHGGGVVSRYGHLHTITVRNGTDVAAGQQIGTMGATGKGSNCSVPYLDFQVHHQGLTGPQVQIKTLQVCYGGGTQSWPNELNATDYWRPLHPMFTKPSGPKYYPVWNDVPRRSVDFPVASTCIGAAPPNTPSRPRPVTLTGSGSTALVARWAKPGSKVGTVRVELSEYHTSTTPHRWDLVQQEVYVDLAGSATSHKFTGLHHTHAYRVRVSFRNSSGWSRASSWVVIHGV